MYFNCFVSIYRFAFGSSVFLKKCVIVKKIFTIYYNHLLLTLSLSLSLSLSLPPSLFLSHTHTHSHSLLFTEAVYYIKGKILWRMNKDKKFKRIEREKDIGNKQWWNDFHQFQISSNSDNIDNSWEREVGDHLNLAPILRNFYFFVIVLDRN